MIRGLSLLCAITGLYSTYGFWVGRTVIQDGWSSKQIFKFCMKLVYAWAANLLSTLAVTTFLVMHHDWVWGIAGFGYVASPFVIGLCATEYEDRRWAIPTLVAVILVAVCGNLYLVFSRNF